MTTINVERTEVLKTGTNKRTGRPWTLFRIIGTYPDGTPLEKVNTFDMLGVGPAEVEIEERVSDGTWTAKLKRDGRNGSSRPQSTRNTTDLEARVAALEDEVSKLNKRLNYILSNPDIDLGDA